MRLSIPLLTLLALVSQSYSLPLPSASPSASLFTPSLDLTRLANRALSLIPTDLPPLHIRRTLSTSVRSLPLPSSVRSLLLPPPPRKRSLRRRSSKRRLSAQERRNANIRRALDATAPRKPALMARGKKAIIEAAEKRVRDVVVAADKARRVVRERAGRAKRAGEKVKEKMRRARDGKTGQEEEVKRDGKVVLGLVKREVANKKVLKKA